ncbi:hypothetical protein KY363_04805 [Candidatus Woesearchaeota archaeon]|nr:hypothetical protein [Candidatus Woesearchaeota archaeon]
MSGKDDMQLPKIGDDIYLPSELYLRHGIDDFQGGLCRIVELETHGPNVFVGVAENPGTKYNLAYLLEIQDELRREYGDQRGRPNPDYRLEFNDDDPLAALIGQVREMDKCKGEK